MNIAYGIKGKTAEKEAYGRRKIWSREKKEQERGLWEIKWEMNRLWGKTTEKLWEITLFLFISHKLINWEWINYTKNMRIWDMKLKNLFW